MTLNKQIEVILEYMLDQGEIHNSSRSDGVPAAINQLEQLMQDIAQSCYLECLAVECGEGQCAEAIATKYPFLVSRHKEKENIVKTLCCNAEITDHLTFIDYHGGGRTNFICCSVCGKVAGDGLYQKTQQDYEDEMLTGTVKAVEEL